MSEQSESGIGEHLEKLRKELIDTSLGRNTLLNFLKGAQKLEIVDEVSRETFDFLVTQKKEMRMLPVPANLLDSEGKCPPLSELKEILHERGGAERHTDAKLQTNLAAENLDKRLLKIFTKAKTHIEEKGANDLYLALGFIHWYESDSSQELRKAPLVLIPVSLKRSQVQSRFKVCYTEEDLGPNLNLMAKLRQDFRIQLPSFDTEQEDGLDIEAYFEGVRKAISLQQRWSVESDEIAFGFFLFGKFQMYRDLAPAHWQLENSEKCAVVKNLLGKGFRQESESGEPSDTPPASKEPEPYLVKDADSTQIKAIQAVSRGEKAIVIEGPPGTGKSQTIVNIIADSLANGKSVLFVAEKMAALEVVKKRLDEAQLGDMVLELHSHKSKKKQFLEELKRILDRPFKEDSSNLKAIQYQHQQFRQRLDDYCIQVKKPILNSEINYIDALGFYLHRDKKIQTIPSKQRIKVGNQKVFQAWKKRDFKEARAIVLRLVQHLEKMGIPADNLFSSSSLKTFSPIDKEACKRKLGDCWKLMQEYQELGVELALSVKLPPPRTLSDCKVLSGVGEYLRDAPNLAGVELVADAWNGERGKVLSLIKTGEEITKLQDAHEGLKKECERTWSTIKELTEKMKEQKQKREGQLVNQAWDENVFTSRQVWLTQGGKWWRICSRDFRVERDKLRGLLRTGKLSSDSNECVEILDDILGYQELVKKFEEMKSFEENQELGEKFFSSQWAGLDSDWGSLQEVSEWIQELHKNMASGALPADMLNAVKYRTENPELPLDEEKFEELGTLPDQIIDAVAASYKALGLQPPEEIDKESLDTLVERFKRWEEKIDSMDDIVRYNQLREKLGMTVLGKIAKASFDWPFSPELLLITLEHAWYESLLDYAYKESDVISEFDRVSHEDAIDEFRKCDEELRQITQRYLIHKHLTWLYTHPVYEDEDILLKREMNKQRAHKAIRVLVTKAGRAIQRIKPVFMMSPMSVATYLPSDALEFDLVIFDEASQIKVAEAFGAMLRGKQTVVVGDKWQMPPSDYFSRSGEAGEDEDEEEESSTKDIESILKLFESKSAPSYMLRWHYRSRHDSLIALSNAEFYDNKLIVAPASGDNPEVQGLRFKPSLNSIYDRGKSRTNPEEALIVAQAVMEHARTKPHISLGVVSFSQGQRNRILQELDRLRKEDPSCEGFFNAEGLDCFFVKNLENVQGDERKVIFISIGYGWDKNGKLAMNFGPVNKQGGERRLNVLITRAQLAMYVFSNFTANDMGIDASTPRGVRVLKEFLLFAETGKLADLPSSTGREPDSSFEEEVMSKIIKMGYSAEPQVGSAGYRIDIAVKDPAKPGRYILAVECDGASYHSSASARDRDCIRQGHLENLGWRFHRIWSTDWWQNQEEAKERLQEAIEQAIAYYKNQDDAELEKASNHKKKEEEETPLSAPTALMDTVEIHTLPLSELIAAFKEVMVAENNPMHIKAAAKKIADSRDIFRVGHKILQRCTDAAKQGARDGEFVFADSFLYIDSQKSARVVDRSDWTHKDIEWVSDQEIRKALLEATEECVDESSKKAVIRGAVRMMGFRRVATNIEGRVSPILESLISQGALIIEGDVVKPGPAENFQS